MFMIQIRLRYIIDTVSLSYRHGLFIIQIRYGYDIDTVSLYNRYALLRISICLEVLPPTLPPPPRKLGVSNFDMKDSG